MENIIRMLLGNAKPDNVKPELLGVAAVYGVGQMQASTSKSDWDDTHPFWGAALGIAYKYAQAWAETGDKSEARKSENFKEAEASSESLKKILIAQGGTSGGIKAIIQVSEDETFPNNPLAEETFRTKPFTGRTSTTANLG